jgi:hypothetical protein
MCLTITKLFQFSKNVLSSVNIQGSQLTVRCDIFACSQPIHKMTVMRIGGTLFTKTHDFAVVACNSYLVTNLVFQALDTCFSP